MPTINQEVDLGFLRHGLGRGPGSQVCVVPVSGKLRTGGRMAPCWMEVQVQVESSI